MNQRPHKSTTHDEEFIHVGQRGTVFFRKEDDGQWYCSGALCHNKDQFNRKTGRTVARRRYFNGMYSKVEGEPSYEYAAKAVAVVDEFLTKRSK